MMNIAIYSPIKKIGKSTLMTHLGFYAIENSIKTTIILKKGDNVVLKNLFANDKYKEKLSDSIVKITNIDGKYKTDFIIYEIDDISGTKNLLNKIDKWIILVDDEFDVRIDGIDKKKIYLLRCGGTSDRTRKKEIRKADEILKEWGYKIFQFSIYFSDWIGKAKLLGLPAWGVTHAKKSIAIQNLELFCYWVFKHKCNDRFI